MPKPNIGQETKQEFIKRCISVVIEDGTAKDGAQANAVCNSMWDEAQKKNMAQKKAVCIKCGNEMIVDDNVDLKKVKCSKCGSEMKWDDKKNMNADNVQIEFDDILGKEILYEGNFGEGKKFTEKDIDEIIENYKNKEVDPSVGLEWPPEVNLDHDDKITQRVKDSLKVVKLGLVSNLYKAFTEKKGNRVATLVADFKSIPRKLSELIKSGHIGQRSIEIFRKIKRNGKELRNVLSAVSFFGKDIPAVPNLEDYIPTICMDDDEKLTVELTHEDMYQEEENLENITISKTEYESLITTKDELSKLKTEIAELKNKEEKKVVVGLQSDKKSLEDKVSLKDNEIAKLKAKVSEYETFKSEVQKEKAQLLQAEADNFITTHIEAGRIEPSYKEMYVNDYIDKKLKKDKNFELWTKEIEGRKSVLSGKLKDSTMQGGAASTTIFSDTSDLNDAIEKLMAKQGKSWEEARKIVMEQNK